MKEILTTRNTLLLDAGITGLNGAVYLALASALDGPLGLERDLLLFAGGFLVVFTGILLYLVSRAEVPAVAVEGVVVVNVAWAIASIIALLTGAIDPKTVGAVWVVMQAGAVAGFAALQSLALAKTA